MKFFPCAICTARTAGHKQWENEVAFGEVLSHWKEIFRSLLEFYSESIHSDQTLTPSTRMAFLTFKRDFPSQYIFLLPNYRITRGSLLHQTVIENREVKTEKNLNLLQNTK